MARQARIFDAEINIGGRSIDMLQAAMFICILAFGVFLRAWHLDSPILWVDEAESSINALTILEHGYPTSTYQNQPIYENTLITPWPESEEYEFKDCSYSDRGVTVYHGWLPLYSIAASLRLFGIEPDIPPDKPTPQHGPDEIRLRTIAPRVPAIVFSFLFLIVFYFLARSTFGQDGALATMFIAASWPLLVEFGREARYYSLTLLLSAFCGLAFWNARRERRWRDYAFLGIGMVLLFHTHVLNFATFSVLLLGLLPVRGPWRESLPKLLLLGGIVLAGTLPWMLATGFLTHASGIPLVAHYIDIKEDILAFLIGKRIVCSLLLLYGLSFLYAFWQSRRRKAQSADLCRKNIPGIMYCIVWGGIACALFSLIVPVASFFQNRLMLMLAVPMVLLIGSAVVFFTRLLKQRGEVQYVALLVACVFVFAVKGPTLWSGSFKPKVENVDEALRQIRYWQLPSDARVYASPNRHLQYTYYSGVPIQSVAPVRKTFLDSYPGELVIVEMPSFAPLKIREIREMAQESGYEMTREEARRARLRLLRESCAWRDPDREGQKSSDGVLDEKLWNTLVASQRNDTRRHIQKYMKGLPVFRGFEAENYLQLWAIFFYRFVDPKSRIGEFRNYRDRIRDAESHILKTGTRLYRCKALTTKPLR